ncbi:MAG: cyclic nucleotide-binding domain-containing protein [Sterolibacterium sp.]|nr:cyclic nucleotide-binding domain-containing protein [Sterolibacterium sp.]
MDIQPIELDLLRSLQPLAELEEERLRELLSMCHREKLERNSNPFRIRDWYGQLLYLIKGELMLQFSDRSTMVVVGGSEEATRPLGKWGLPTISAKAITQIELVRFDEEMLDIMLTWDQLAQLKMVQGQVEQGIAGEGVSSTDWRMMPGMFAAQNLAHGAFAALPPAHIGQLLQRFQRIKVRRGEEVVRQGEAGDYYYLIESGRCQVSRMVAGTPLLLADLKPGDAFGEEALVTDATRNASVTMKTDGILLRLDKHDFVELLRAPLLHTLSPAKAQQHAMAGAIWLDVRCATEYKYDGIKGARNLPLDEIRLAYTSLDPKKEYIAYCQSGRRSSAAAFLLSQRGFRASLLEGGLAGGLRWEDGSDKGVRKS